MEQCTINELLHDAEQEDSDKRLCEILAKWHPESRKILINYTDYNNCEYPQVLTILDRGKSERTEHFKSWTEMGKRYMDIVFDYYDKHIIYENKKWESLSLKKFYYYKDKELDKIYEGFILRDYEV